MKTLRRNACLQGYVPAFSLYPTGGGDDPWEDTRIAYEEVDYALWQARHDGVPELEKYTRGTENERPAQEFGKSIRKPISDTPPHSVLSSTGAKAEREKREASAYKASGKTEAVVPKSVNLLILSSKQEGK